MAVVGGERGAVVVVDDVHLPDALEHPVEATQEEHRRLARPDDDVRHIAGGVVDEEQGNATGPVRARAEVLAVAQHDLEAALLREPALVRRRRPSRARPYAQPAQCAPGRGAVDVLGSREQPGDDRASKQLGDAGATVGPLLGHEELDELRVEDVGGPRRPRGWREAGEPARRGGGEPPVDRSRAHATRPMVEPDVILAGDGADRVREGVSAEHPDPDLREDGVAEQDDVGRQGGGGDQKGLVERPQSLRKWPWKATYRIR